VTSRIRVLVADDDAVMRDTLADVVRSDADLELVAAASDAQEAVELTHLHRPDVALLDVMMPGGGGPRAAREIRAASPGTRVVALSAFDERGAVLEMLQAGAAGYLVKGASVEEILEGIRRAARGEAPLSSGVAADVIEELTGRLEQEAGEAERRRLAIERIRGVLEGDRLAVVFQPIFDLADGRIVGVEALARFSAEPHRGPDAWFAEAVSVGLSVDLELKAVITALEHFRSLPEGAYLSLNVSPHTIVSGRLAKVLAGAPLDRIVLEITEHAPVADYNALADVLRPFRTAGGRVAVDDAGAGFASLSHIVRLAPDVIKLDVTLTGGIHADRTRRALAAALISFAREIGAVIVAEGVETQDELDALCGLGVPQGQGHHLARPLPPENLPSVEASSWSASSAPSSVLRALEALDDRRGRA
jgi:EAL domain-containing protein (putative c-di-GMP-specific phosphodiesterase class I)/CheY-like chemotaxis protein